MKAILALLLLPAACLAEIVGNDVEYRHGDTVLEGYHAYDDAATGPRPAVLVVHQWTGLSDYEKHRCKMLAELGYNVFALDIYGKGIRPAPPEAGTHAGRFKGDRELFRARLGAGLKVLREDPMTDPAKIAAIGYCFGGTGVLELARSGADIGGVVSFHGGLAAAGGMEAQSDTLKASVLVCHGADDPFVPRPEVTAFEEEMKAAGADWQMISYGGAVHAFTQKAAGDDKSKGAAYDESADRRSWEAMKAFLAEVFG